MRIIGGLWRGRRIATPKGQVTRPTSDRVREALFSALEARGVLQGAVVLDAFAGTGALGLEALSRGAERALFVESDAHALATLRNNISLLGAGSRCTVLAGDVFRAPRRLPGGTAPYSLLFLDPPYRIDKAEVRGLIESLRDAGLIIRETVMVWEHRTGDEDAWPQWADPLTEKRYGDTVISIATVGADGEGQ